MTEQQPLLISPRDAAQALGISERTLWTITQRGDLPHLKIGRLVRYSITDVQNWIEQTKQNGQADHATACQRCGQPATHQHVDPLRSVDEARCDYCCDRNCNHLNNLTEQN